MGYTPKIDIYPTLSSPFQNKVITCHFVKLPNLATMFFCTIEYYAILAFSIISLYYVVYICVGKWDRP